MQLVQSTKRAKGFHELEDNKVVDDGNSHISIYSNGTKPAQ